MSGFLLGVWQAGHLGATRAIWKQCHEGKRKGVRLSGAEGGKGAGRTEPRGLNLNETELVVERPGMPSVSLQGVLVGERQSLELRGSSVCCLAPH